MTALPNPFIYGKIVYEDDFFDRTKERKRLLQLLQGRNNVLILGDRRIGKTSLLLNCFEELKKKNKSIFYFNLDPITSTKSFIERYGQLFTKKKSLAKRAVYLLKLCLKGFKLDIQLDDKGIPTASIQWEGAGKLSLTSLQEILELPQILARKGRQRFIICFDEFQIARDMEDADLISEMRAAFQKHDKITYVFMGSEIKILNQLFESPKEKFFHSAITFPVGPILRSEFIDFIKKNFHKRKITISESLGDFICDWAGDIPANIQHLCSCLWDHLLNDIKNVTKTDLQRAIQKEIESQDQHYLQIWKTIGDVHDQTILKRLAKAKYLAPTSAEFSVVLGMNSSTISRRLQQVTSRTRGAIIHLRSEGYVFSDPFFEEWIRQKT